MKIAILAPFLTSTGGAEKVTGIHYRELSKEHEVTVFTSVYDKKVYPEYFGNTKVIELMPYAEKLPMFRTLTNILWAVKNANFLKEFDVILAETPNTHITASKAKKWDKKVIWYSEHPNKIAYGLEDRGTIINSLMKLTIPADKTAVENIDVIFANSKFMENEFKKIYSDEITKKIKVLYPPTDLDGYKHKKSKGYFLCVSRLEQVKRVDVMIEVFNETDKELIIVGSGPEEEKLKKIAGKNIRFAGRVSEEKLKELYASCEAAVQLNTREDFGLAPIEAGISGKPTIAVNEGGFKETIKKNTGVLINEPYKASLIKVLKNWKNKFKPIDCINNAKKYSTKEHMKALTKFL